MVAPDDPPLVVLALENEFRHPDLGRRAVAQAEGRHAVDALIESGIADRAIGLGLAAADHVGSLVQGVTIEHDAAVEAHDDAARRRRRQRTLRVVALRAQVGVGRRDAAGRGRLRRLGPGRRQRSRRRWGGLGDGLAACETTNDGSARQQKLTHSCPPHLAGRHGASWPRDLRGAYCRRPPIAATVRLRGAWQSRNTVAVAPQVAISPVRRSRPPQRTPCAAEGARCPRRCRRGRRPDGRRGAPAVPSAAAPAPACRDGSRSETLARERPGPRLPPPPGGATARRAPNLSTARAVAALAGPVPASVHPADGRPPRARRRAAHRPPPPVTAGAPGRGAQARGPAPGVPDRHRGAGPLLPPSAAGRRRRADRAVGADR